MAGLERVDHGLDYVGGTAYMFLTTTKYDWPDVDEDDIDLDTFQQTLGGTILFDGAPYEEREESESPTLFDSDPYGEKGKGKRKGKG